MRELWTGLLCLAIAASPALGEVQWTFDTELSLRYSTYDKEDTLRGDGDDYGEARLYSEITGLFGDKFQLTLTPMVQYDSEDRTDSDDYEFLDDGVLRPAGTFRELYATYYGKSFEISVGKKIFNWGVAAVYKPTDNINPADLLDPPTLEKLGVPAFSFYKFGKKVDFEFVAIPVFTPHRLPGTNNRWVIIPGENDVREQINDPIFAVDRMLPTSDFDNLQGGFRLKSSTLANGWDLELSAFRGFESFGLFRLEEVLPPIVNVDLIYPEYWEVGGGFSTTRGSWEYHGEVAYHVTKDEAQDDDYMQYVAGFTYTAEIGGVLDRILFTLEYLGEGRTRERPEDSDFVNTGFDRVLTDTGLTGVSFVFSDDTAVDLAGTANFADEGSAIQLSLTHRFATFFQIKAGIDVFNGDPGSFHGNWDDNDRAFFFTNWAF